MYPNIKERQDRKQFIHDELLALTEHKRSIDREIIRLEKELQVLKLLEEIN